MAREHIVVEVPPNRGCVAAQSCLSGLMLITQSLLTRESIIVEVMLPLEVHLSGGAFVAQSFPVKDHICP
jgi:hypothetical protein